MSELGQKDLAERHLKRGIELDPGNWEPYGRYAAFLQRNHRELEAIPLLEKALEIRPTDSGLKATLCKVLAMSGRTAEAKTLLADLEHDPNKKASAFFEMALAYEAVGERKSAFSALTKAVEGGYPLGAIQNEAQFVQLRRDAQYQTLAARGNSK